MERPGSNEDTIPQEPVFECGQAETISVRGMTAAVEQKRQLLPPIDKSKREAWKLTHKEAKQNAENSD